MFRLKPRGKERTRELDPEEGRRRFRREPDGADRYVPDVGEDRADDGRDRGGEESRRAQAVGIPAKAGIQPGQCQGRKEAGFPRSRERREVPSFREPQKATLVDSVPAGAAWLHEMKYDGYRCLLALAGGEARIYTRTGLDWTDKFPEIAAAAAAIDCGSALLDGEIVALDDKGKTSFSALQEAISEGGRGLTLFLFDALEIDGETLGDAAQYRAQAAARRPRSARGTPPHPLCRPYPRQGRAAVRGDVRGRAGRDHLEEGRRPLSPCAAPRTGSRSNARCGRNS